VVCQKNSTVLDLRYEIKEDLAQTPVFHLESDGSIYSGHTLTASLVCIFWIRASFRLYGCHVAFFIHQALGLHCYDLERPKNLPNCLHKDQTTDQRASEHDKGRTQQAHTGGHSMETGSLPNRSEPASG